MDIREKLVELLTEFYGCDPMYYDVDALAIADHLVSNGVTVQEWISVDDRLPPYNHDVLVYRPNMAMKIMVDSYNGYYGEDDNEWYEGWAKYGNDIHGKPIITHWMPLPNRRKENDYAL